MKPWITIYVLIAIILIISALAMVIRKTRYKNMGENVPERRLTIWLMLFWIVMLLAFSILRACGQGDSCSGNNLPYPSPPNCKNFLPRDSATICYYLVAQGPTVYFNPFVIASCTNVQRQVLLYDSACNLIDSDALGSNAVTPGATYQVCFVFYCSGSGTGITGSCIFDALPIKLLYFTHTLFYEQQRVHLLWATASETNNDRFEIERSTDGIHFFLITTLPGAGNSTQSNTYFYEDTNPDLINYYRLKQVDYDGNYSYSDVEFVLNKKETYYRVYSLQGVLLRSGRTIQLQGLSPGMYVFESSDDTRVKRWIAPMIKAEK